MSDHSAWYYTISPDAFSRYYLIKEHIKKTFGKKRINILDVGGNDNSLWAMIESENLPYSLTVIDILPPDEKAKNYRYVQGDASNMDFENASFDVVICTDTLEHVPDANKEKLVLECIRVVKDLLIIAAPFESEKIEYSERLANEYFVKLTGRDHPWLIEHFQFHRPHKKQTELILKRNNLQYFSYGSINLQNWMLMILCHFYSVRIGSEPVELQEINRFYNTHCLNMGDFTEPTYRTFYVALKRETINYKKIMIRPDKKINIYDKIKWEQLMLTYFMNKIFKGDLQEDPYTKLDKFSKKSQLLEKAYKDQQKELMQLSLHAQNLESILTSIKTSKFFRLWQVYATLKKKIHSSSK